jgi:hypothetical protein
MCQIDATTHEWLEDRAPGFALHAAIDDATGIVIGAIFRQNECREGYSRVMMQGIKRYGIPLGLYRVRHTLFRSPNEKLTVEQELAGERNPFPFWQGNSRFEHRAHESTLSSS